MSSVYYNPSTYILFNATFKIGKIFTLKLESPPFTNSRIPIILFLIIMPNII